jgi:hypothetical protein
LEIGDLGQVFEFLLTQVAQVIGRTARDRFGSRDFSVQVGDIREDFVGRGDISADLSIQIGVNAREPTCGLIEGGG